MQRIFSRIKYTHPCTAMGLFIFTTAFYYAQKPMLKYAEYFERKELI